MLNLIEKGVDTYFAYLPRKQPENDNIHHIQLIAHRGVYGKKLNSVENTHAAFALAQQFGCWGIEMDVHATADDVLVVNHDPDLLRLWGVNLRIKDLSFQQLRQYAPLVPSLNEVVEQYGRHLHLFIELKKPFHSEEALEASLKPLTACIDYHLLSLNESIFASLSRFPRQALLLVAGHNNTASFCEISLQKQYGGVLGHYLLLNNSRIQKLQQAKQAVGIGFVNSKFSLYREANRGLQWIFTNNVLDVSSHLNLLREKSL